MIRKMPAPDLIRVGRRLCVTGLRIIVSEATRCGILLPLRSSHRQSFWARFELFEQKVEKEVLFLAGRSHRIAMAIEAVFHGGLLRLGSLVGKRARYGGA